MEAMAKVLVVNQERCTGCRLCESVCTVKHDGVVNPMRARIKIEKWEHEGLYVPMICQQSSPCAGMYSPRSKLMTVPPSQRISAVKWVSASDPGATFGAKIGDTGQVWANTVCGFSAQPVIPSR